MADRSTIEELQTAVEHKQQELRLEAEPERRNTLLAQLFSLRTLLRAEEEELYFSLELPEPLPEDLSGLSFEELEALEIATGLQQRFLQIAKRELSPEDQESKLNRARALALQDQGLSTELERRRAEAYEPGPDGAPVYEPSGYEAQPGMVKSRPENNGYYVEQFRNHPWYPAILTAHLELEELIPGYNITQIKEKFGGLRYYFSYPDPIVLREDRPAYSTEDKIRAIADRIIARAEGWAAGYEHAQRTDELLTDD